MQYLAKDAAKKLVFSVFGPPVISLFVLFGFSLAETEVSTPSTIGNDGPYGEGVAPLENLATNIAFKAGLIRRPSAAEEEVLRKVTEPGSTFWLRQADGCGDHVTQAIIATESYLRPQWRRTLEYEVANATNILFGTYPDWSLGPAQVKRSTLLSTIDDAQKWIEERTGEHPNSTFDNDYLLGMVRNLCRSADIIELTSFLSDEIGADAEVRALRHVGGQGTPTIPGIVEYSSVVSVIASVILPEAETNFGLLNSGQGHVEEENRAILRASSGENSKFDAVTRYRVSRDRVWINVDGVCLFISRFLSDRPRKESGVLADLEFNENKTEGLSSFSQTYQSLLPKSASQEADVVRIVKRVQRVEKSIQPVLQHLNLDLSNLKLSVPKTSHEKQFFGFYPQCSVFIY